MKKTTLLFIFICTVFSNGYAQQKYAADKKEIISVMMSQRDAWNKGDLEGYMEGYWKSDSLKFIGKSGITTGWQKTLENYRKGYPDKAAMGKLDFSGIQVEILSPSSAFVIGKWKLTREKDTPQGYYTLLFKKMNKKWMVVVDHSS